MSNRTADPCSRRPPRPAGRWPVPRAMLSAGLVLLIGPMAGPLGMARGQEPAPPPGEQKADAPVQPAAEVPAEEPAAEGVTAVDGTEAKMVEAFGQLADSDATVREDARNRLMGLERRYLPTLQKLVERSRPLLPSQAAVLRQIVSHVYLAGEPYASNGNMGFLGVRMLPTDVSTARPPGGAAEDPPGDAAGDPPGEAEAPAVAPGAEAFLASRKGVVISERMPGFVGYRMLLDGDVIVGLADQPELQFHTQDDFSAAVKRVGAGQAVRFNILRRGRLTKVAITLDPRPDAAGDGHVGGPMDELLARRRYKVEQYWDDVFGPMLKERVG